ncbi:MAG: HypC/HybG/HupF family hydrogenase formation chaperone [Candidatus Pacearchaeota archaeon]|jgi:hydrogenase expression/formation protein HypC
MCLTIPGKVIEIGTNRFVIDYLSTKREVNISLVDVKIGDYVIVSNKIIISKVNKDQAKKFFELIN